MAEWVKMTNPELGDASSAQVTRQAYDLTWKALGWKLVKPDKKPIRKDTD